MKTIWKYPFSVADRFTLSMPEGAQILHVDLQSGIPCLWALVIPERPPTEVGFRVFGTGHPFLGGLGANLVHVGTFQQGPLVWHVFRECDV
jgi:hypothetical protein